MKQFLLRQDKSMVALAIVFFLSVGAMILHVSSLQSSLLRASAVYTASIFSEILIDVRALYTSEVVQPASAFGMDVTHDYLLTGNAIPLPATFSMRLGELIGRHATGARAGRCDFPLEGSQRRQPLPGGRPAHCRRKGAGRSARKRSRRIRDAVGV